MGTNSAALMLHSCSTTMDLKSPLRKFRLSSRPPRTKSNHTGQCSSPRLLRVPMLELSSPTLDLLDLLLDQPDLLTPAPLSKKSKKKRRKNLKMLIWVVFSETMMTIEVLKPFDGKCFQ